MILHKTRRQMSLQSEDPTNLTFYVHKCLQRSKRLQIYYKAVMGLIEVKGIGGVGKNLGAPRANYLYAANENYPTAENVQKKGDLRERDFFVTLFSTTNRH